MIDDEYICLSLELAHLDCAYRNLLAYNDNERSVFEKILEHDHGASLLFIKDYKVMMDYCETHNIRKINIRSLSELLSVNNLVMCSSINVQKYSWTKYFNPDYSFSTSIFLTSIMKLDDRSHGSNLKTIASVREELLKRMVELDYSLYSTSDSFRGQLLRAYI